VSRTTGPDESDRHDGAFLLISIDELASGQRFPVYQQPGA